MDSNSISPCVDVGVVVQDPYTGEVEGRSKSTQLQSRTVRRHLSSHMKHLHTLSSFLSSSPLPPSPFSSPSLFPPCLPEETVLWYVSRVECRRGCHSERVQGGVCTEGWLCEDISLGRLLGALRVGEGVQRPACTIGIGKAK